MIPGIATGIAAEQANRMIRKVEEEEQDQGLLSLFKQQTHFLQLIAERQSPLLTPPENDPTPIFPYPQQFRVPDFARPHFALFLSSGVLSANGVYSQAVTSARLHFEIPGAGVHIRTLVPGWNLLDLPPQTLISSADGNTYNVIISFRDDPISDTASQSSIATDFVSPFFGNAAALTANTDYVFKWGALGVTRVNHLMIQNNTAANLNYDTDAVATAGSAVLSPGQPVWLDVKTAGLHLLQNGTPNVNGNTAGNIVVKGWL